MTFIASVKAKDGVAIIADYLVSAQERTLNIKEWNKHIYNWDKSKPLDEKEITRLFLKKTAYNRDYEKKLIQFDNYTAVTATGMANLNGKSVSTLVSKISKKLLRVKRYNPLYFDKNLKSFVNELEKEAIEQINRLGYVLKTDFFIAQYHPTSEKTKIHRVSVKTSLAKDLKMKGFSPIVSKEENISIVCAGQSKIAHRILYGDFFSFLSLSPIMTDLMRDRLSKLGLEENKGLPKGFFDSLFDYTKIIKNKKIFEDAQITNLSNLSLQQAVDLAALLMRIEMDFQKYTKLIPTVGGKIKIAVIDEDGFKFIRGKAIKDPFD